MRDSTMSTNGATTQHQRTLRAAIKRADKGVPVFPCNKYKKPLTPNGYKDATTKQEVILQWWKEYRDIACLGMPTGKVSGYWALDVDTDNGKRGAESLKELEDTYGPLPDTKTFRTGGGGMQYVFNYPEGFDIRNSAGTLGEGLDVRGNGGYIITPPSFSYKGEYVWVDKGKATDPPDGLVDLLLEDTRKGKKGGSQSSFDEDGFLIIPDGARDDTLFREASRFRGLGYPIEAAIDALRVIDELCAEYPEGKDRTDRSVEEIVDSVFKRYPPGVFRVDQGGRNGILPFPIDAMPEKIRAFIRETAKALDCPIDLVGVPVLGSLAAAIANSRRASVKRGWSVSTSLYLAAISPPGSGKSPAMSKATRPVKDRQREQKETYDECKREYDCEKRRYDGLNKNERARTAPPQKPIFPRTWVDDTTVEALASRLKENPRGLYLTQDELTGWISGMNQYKNGKGNDRQKYLQMWDNQTISVDRKSSDEPLIVERPLISILGGIQPERLKDLVDERGDGFFDRFLVAYPEEQIARPGSEETSPEAEESYHGLIRSLYRLEPKEDGTPVRVPFTEGAFERFQEFSNRLADEQEFAGHPAALRCHLSKLKEYLARIALILATCRDPLPCDTLRGLFSTDTTNTTDTSSDTKREEREVLPEDVEKAWALIDYFKSHLYRVYDHTNIYDTKAKVASELIRYLSNNMSGKWVAHSALEWGKVLPSAPGNANAVAYLLKEIAEEQESITLERGYQGKSRVIKIRLEKGVGAVGSVGQESANGHHPNAGGQE
jgi:hypothetical protein